MMMADCFFVFLAGLDSADSFDTWNSIHVDLQDRIISPIVNHDRIVLTSVFCGTASLLAQTRTQIELFANNIIKGIDLTPLHDDTEEERRLKLDVIDAPFYSLNFNGCGVDYGCAGVIFGYGLEQNCEKIIILLRKLS